jgi:vacuolar protein sorting-associated protein 13A/C
VDPIVLSCSQFPALQRYNEISISLRTETCHSLNCLFAIEIPQLLMSRGRQIDQAKITALVDFDEFAVSLDNEQYRDIFGLISHFGRLIRAHKVSGSRHFAIEIACSLTVSPQYRKLRPPPTVTPKTNPQAYWSFAGKAILDQVHEKNYHWSWDYFRERKNERKNYINLFKAKRLSTISAPQQTSLSDLEDKLSFEDIKFYRSLAELQLKKEKPIVGKYDHA